AQYFEHFAGRPAVFVTAQGSAASAVPGSWAMREKALGVEGPYERGQHLRMTPEGLPPLEGVVAFAYPGYEFIGLRTADGLYRFHEMSAMGMPIAVGHYIYDDVDREAAEQARTPWLERGFAWTADGSSCAVGPCRPTLKGCRPPCRAGAHVNGRGPTGPGWRPPCCQGPRPFGGPPRHLPPAHPVAALRARPGRTSIPRPSTTYA